MSVNKVILIGRLGKDPDIKKMMNGESITNVTLATSENWKDKSGTKQEKTEWHNLVFYRRLAEIAGEYLKKGSQIYVEGKLQTRKWRTKEGQDRYTTDIIVGEMQMLGGKLVRQPSLLKSKHRSPMMISKVFRSAIMSAAAPLFVRLTTLKSNSKLSISISHLQRLDGHFDWQFTWRARDSRNKPSYKQLTHGGAMRKVILATLLAVVSTCAFADWILLTTLSNGDRIYSGDIRRTHDIVKVRILHDDRIPTYNANGSITNSSTMIDEYDCRNDTYRTVGLRVWSGHMGTGTDPTAGAPDANGDWTSIQPNSFVSHMADSLCGNK